MELTKIKANILQLEGYLNQSRLGLRGVPVLIHIDNIVSLDSARIFKPFWKYRRSYSPNRGCNTGNIPLLYIIGTGYYEDQTNFDI